MPRRARSAAALLGCSGGLEQQRSGCRHLSPPLVTCNTGPSALPPTMPPPAVPPRATCAAPPPRTQVRRGGPARAARTARCARALRAPQQRQRVIPAPRPPHHTAARAQPRQAATRTSKALLATALLVLLGATCAPAAAPAGPRGAGDCLAGRALAGLDECPPRWPCANGGRLEAPSGAAEPAAGPSSSTCPKLWAQNMREGSPARAPPWLGPLS